VLAFIYLLERELAVLNLPTAKLREQISGRRGWVRTLGEKARGTLENWFALGPGCLGWPGCAWTAAEWDAGCCDMRALVGWLDVMHLALRVWVVIRRANGCGTC
jgi:hypothetical protein